MKNEPVAWIIDASMTDCDDNFIWNTGNYPDWQVKDWIPLYNHPVKELTMTDDEVMDLWNEQSSHPIDFARAILRKAQEK